MGDLRAGIIPVTPFQQNCTVLFDQDTKSGVVIDPGGDVDVILQTIAENDLTIEAIWLTHGHIDNAAGADERVAAKSSGCPIIGRMRPNLALLSRSGAPGQIVRCSRWRRNCHVGPVAESTGDKVSFGAHEFEVYHLLVTRRCHVIFSTTEREGFAHLGDVLVCRLSRPAPTFLAA